MLEAVACPHAVLISVTRKGLNTGRLTSHVREAVAMSTICVSKMRKWRCHRALNDSLYAPKAQSAHGLHPGKKLWIERAKLSDAHVEAAGHKEEEALVRTQAHPLVLAPLSLVSPSSWDPSLFLPHCIYHGIFLSNFLLPTSWDP